MGHMECGHFCIAIPRQAGSRRDHKVIILPDLLRFRLHGLIAETNQRQESPTGETRGWPARTTFSRLFESPQVSIFQRGSYYLVRGPVAGAHIHLLRCSSSFLTCVLVREGVGRINPNLYSVFKGEQHGGHTSY